MYLVAAMVFGKWGDSSLVTLFCESCVTDCIFMNNGYLFLSISDSLTLVPTVPPTTPASSTVPSDECDDDQANCHSGTGDDYDQTGANTRLQRLHPYLLHLAPFAMLITLC